MAGNPSLQEVEAELARRNSEAMRGAAFANSGRLSVEDINRELARRQSAQRDEQQSQRGAQHAGERAAERSVLRNSMPGGLGHIAQPFANMITDPARREAFGESVSAFARDVQQLPSQDWGQIARDTGDAIVSGVRNLPQTAQQVAQNLPQIARMATYGPFVDEERQQQEIDAARYRGDDATVQSAARQANASTGQAATNAISVAGAPFLATPASAGAFTAAVTAPTAFSGDAPLAERIPQGVATTLGASAFGAGAQQVANSVTRGLQPQPRRGRAPSSERAAAFERAGVRPTAAAVIGGESGGGDSGVGGVGAGGVGGGEYGNASMATRLHPRTTSRFCRTFYKSKFMIISPASAGLSLFLRIAECIKQLLLCQLHSAQIFGVFRAPVIPAEFVGCRYTSSTERRRKSYAGIIILHSSIRYRCEPRRFLCVARYGRSRKQQVVKLLLMVTYVVLDIFRGLCAFWRCFFVV